MVVTQIAARGITDARVLAAMRKVPRERFVPENLRSSAYLDGPLPIGHEQTISQSYIVAFMTEALRLREGDKVLEIGTGSGYQAAVVAECCRQVYTIEIVEPLAERAASTLKALGYSNIEVRHGDGYRGWPEHAPFDAIIVTAAPDHVPEPLVAQLAVGGRMVIPVGDVVQNIVLIEKTMTGTTSRRLLPVSVRAHDRRGGATVGPIAGSCHGKFSSRAERPPRDVIASVHPLLRSRTLPRARCP